MNQKLKGRFAENLSAAGHKSDNCVKGEEKRSDQQGPREYNEGA
jgi:hypothetical protein